MAPRVTGYRDRCECRRVNDAARDLVDAFAAEHLARMAAEAALAAQDSDFDVHAVGINFYFDGHDGTGGEFPPEQWTLGDGDDGDAHLPETAISEIMDAISPWLMHFGAIGLVRADGLQSALMGGLAPASPEPTFYAVCAAGTSAAEVASLGKFEPITLPIGAFPGMSLTITSYVRPINASLLFEALRHCTEQVGPWGGSAGAIALPEADEDREQFLQRSAIRSDRAERLVERWRRSGGDLALFGMLGSADERASGNQKIEWLVEDSLGGRIPRGCVTLVVGNNASGKSSATHAIAAALGSPEALTLRAVFGAEVTGQYEVALISGEDGEGTLNHRAAAHSTLWGRPSYFVIDGIAARLEDVLETLERTPRLDLLVVDPVRAFLDGDEDSSAVVSKFYDRLTRIARDKNCAVIAVHHLTKGRPRRLSDMLPMVRGSGVHTDRARLVIGMIYRGADIVELGPIKCNVPGLWADVNVGEFYTRDAATFTLKPANVLAAQSSPGSNGEPNAAVTRVMAAVTDQNNGRIVTRKTGRSGLFEARLPSLAGLSRSVILTAISSLIEAGKIRDDGEHGLVAVATPNPSSEAS